MVTKQTLNKDGTIRKQGSGRKKGSKSFVKVTFSELSRFINEHTPIQVSRVWLENLGFDPQESESPKINLTEEKETHKIQFTIRND